MIPVRDAVWQCRGNCGMIKIIIDAIVGAALYVIISIVLRIEELNEVLSMLKNKVAKGER